MPTPPTSERNGALFGERIPFVQMLHQERQEAVGRMHDGLYHWLTHYQQLMVLEAAIVGVVIPVLYAARPGLVNPWFLRRAVVWLGFSVFVGVLICGVCKWAMVLIMYRLQQQFTRQDEVIAGGDDEASIATRPHDVNEPFKPEATKLLWLAYSGIIGDVLFYGAFLVGLYDLFSGFLRT